MGDEMDRYYPSDPEAEEALIRKASQGSLDAFNQLVLRYQDLAYHQAYALLGDAVSAEDTTQEGLIKAFLNIRRFRGGSFRAWLLKIVTNAAYDLLRRSRNHSDLPLCPEDEYGEEFESPAWSADPSASVEAAVEQNEDARRLHRLLGELPAVYRSALVLVDLYEMDYAEAAEALQVPVGTIKSRLARARLQIGVKLRGDRAYFFPLSQSLPAVQSR
jgi:RNA polymerase sigma-70 factor (ECF subfamily)